MRKLQSALFFIVCCFYTAYGYTLSQTDIQKSDTPQLELTEKEKSVIEALSPVKVWYNPLQTPLSFDEDSKPAGMSVELFNIIASRLGAKVSWVEGMNFSKALSALQKGEVDVVNLYSEYNASRKNIKTVGPYLITPFVAVGSTQMPEISDMKALEGKRLVMVREFQQTLTLGDRYPSLNVTLVDTIEEAYNKLLTKKADIFIDNATHASFYLHTKMIADLKILGVLPVSRLGQLKLYFGVGTNNPDLHHLIQKSFDSISQATLSALRSRWIDDVLTGPTVFHLSEAEKQWLIKHPRIKVVLHPDRAPIEYLNNEGNFHGISVDYLKRLGEILGVEFIIVQGSDWQEGVNAVKHKKADMLTSFIHSPAHQEFVVFSKPHMEVPLIVYTKSSNTDIETVLTAEGNKVGYLVDSSVDQWLDSHYPMLTQVPMMSQTEALQMLNNGELDIFIGNALTASYIISRDKLDAITESKELQHNRKLGFAIRDDWPVLAQILQKAMDAIPVQEHEDIVNHWKSIKFEHKTSYRFFWEVFGVVLFVLLVTVYSSYRLKQLVAKRTKELNESEAQLRLILESTAEGILGLDIHGKTIFANSAAHRMLGFEANALLSVKIDELMRCGENGLNACSSHTCSVKAAYKGVYTQTDSEMFRCKDGTLLAVEYRATPTFRENEIVGIVVSFNDITERKRSELTLKESEERFRGFFERNSSVMLLVEPEYGSIVEANSAASNYYGYEKTSLEQMLISDINILTPQQIQIELQHALKEERSYFNFRHRKANGEVSDVEVYSTPIISNGKKLLFSIIHDITERKKAEKKVLHQSHFDMLTDIPNRFLTMDRLDQKILEAQRSNKKVALLFLDLDNFKKINDSLGHDIGDQILIETSRRFIKELKSDDTAGRLGGDEFIAVLGGLETPLEALAITEKILKTFDSVYKLQSRDIVITGSIGIAIYPDDGLKSYELLRNAEAAMYHAKEQGRNTFAFFTESMNTQIVRRLQLEEQMHGAIERGEFSLHYQPKISISEKRIVGAEALLRWENPVLGFVSPVEFIPLAEDNGMIVSIGKFVIKEALETLATWNSDFMSEFSMAINLSPRQLRDPDLVHSIEHIVAKTGVKCELIELEITEGVLMHAQEYVVDVLDTLVGLGIKLAMDDFGTGFSSLNYLRSYPFNVLKIDRTFVKDITDDKADLELVTAAIAMAHGLGLEVVAEGVETKEQLELLEVQKCDIAQGYYFSKPVTYDALKTFCTNHKEQSSN